MSEIFIKTNEIIRQLINDVPRICSLGHVNERYLHHAFSRMMQGYPIFDESGQSLFHPEWATHINGLRDDKGGLYSKGDKSYKVDLNGWPGFIDFAISNYNNPDCAVEFKMVKSLNKGISFDYMKLLDSRNSIKSAVSLVVYYGPAEISTDDFDGYLDGAKKELKQNSYLEENREIHFYAVAVNDGRITTRLECTSTNLPFRDLTI